MQILVRLKKCQMGEIFARSKRDYENLFNTIKNNYDGGLWNVQLVKMAVIKGLITKDEYKEITGLTYKDTK